jgi:flagellum-specific peptidoglycan hydrolase FlgJ
MQVPMQTTAETMANVRKALVRAWRARMRSPVSAPVLALMLALVDLETAAGRAIHNHNLGNMVATRDQQARAPFFVGDDSGNTRVFRAFASLDDGARALVRLLLSDGKPHWRAGLMSGDPKMFAHGLKRDGYYEAGEERYARVLTQRWQRYSPGNNTASRQSSPNALPLVAGAVAVTGLVAWAVFR